MKVSFARSALVGATLAVAMAAPVLAEAGKSTKIGSEDWSKISRFTAEGHWVFSVLDDDCWKTDVNNGNSEKVPGTGWKETTRLAATSVGGDLFLISLSGNDAFVTFVKTGKFVKIEGNWGNTRCLDVDGAKLYSTNGKFCWETDLNQAPPVAKKICPDEDWTEVRAMKVMNGTIYSITDKLWATPLNGSAKSRQVGTADWTKVTRFTAVNGGLYSIHGKDLMFTDPSSGASKKIGTDDWSEVKYLVGTDKFLFSVSGKDLWRTETK